MGPSAMRQASAEISNASTSSIELNTRFLRRFTSCPPPRRNSPKLSLADFAQLREALSFQPEPSQPPILDRDDVLQAHTALVAREAALDAQEEVRTRKAVVGPGKHFSSAGLERLKRVGLDPKQLRTDEVGRGKVLVCRIASSKSVRTVGLHLVIEDSQGRLAPLQVHHLPSRDFSDQFALGLYYAIKEPNIRSSRDGFVVRVESPADVVRLFPSSPLLANLEFPPPRHLPVIQKTAAQYKEEGNRLFGAQRFAGARDAYSLALDLVSGDDTLKLALLANRAAVLLKLRLYTSALADATDALDLNPSPSLRQKLLFRAASASYALQSHMDCLLHLAELLRLSPADEAVLDLQRRLHLRLGEVNHGGYDWPSMFQSALKADELDVADFVANDAFEVRRIKGKGRGLVATRAIEPGELLMVQRPLAMGRGNSRSKLFVVGANLYTDTIDPPAVGELVAHLAERMADDPSIRRRTLQLYAGPDQLPVTSSGVDISRLEGIATFNAFHTESLAQKTKTLSPVEERQQNIHAPSSLYDLPSMLNHSCVGDSVSYSFLADTFFLRARIPISAGDELVDSYVDSMEGLAKRTEKLDKHGFVCRCMLCEMDRADGPARCEERERLAQELEELTDRIHGTQAQDPAPLLSTIFAYVDKIAATHLPSRGALRPALYPAYRLLGANLASLKRHAEAIQTELKALAALGAVFEGEKVVQVPRLGDVNAVLSCLFIAIQQQKLERSPKSWIAIARLIERGQAGEALFEARYADWAKKNGLDLQG